MKNLSNKKNGDWEKKRNGKQTYLAPLCEGGGYNINIMDK